MPLGDGIARRESRTRRVWLWGSAGEIFIGKPAGGAEGGRGRARGLLLACSFTWRGRRVLAKPGLPTAFFLAHTKHSFPPSLCLLLSVKQGADLSSLARIFYLYPRLADVHEGQFQPFCITRKHPHLLSTSLPAHLHPDLLGWSPGAAVTNRHLLLLEPLSPLGCCLHPLSMSAAACHRMWLLW